ncbi:MAG: 30S ribosomal protein S9 [Candidatus Nasuia deltocephalinicola]
MIWYYGTGKKKKSIAKVFIKKGQKKIKINNKSLKKYFNRKMNYNLIFEPVYITNINNIEIMVKVYGGGKSSQIFAIRNGLSKAILNYNKIYKKILSDKNLLSRDPRMVERKKLGKHKARKSKQFSKR